MAQLAGRLVDIRDSDGKVLRFRSGDGAVVKDTQGNAYIDLVCGFGPVVVGHGDTEFGSMVGHSMEEGLHFPGLSTLHHEYVENHLPSEFVNWSAVLFKSSSESVAGAVRICRQATSRHRIIRCGFIGWLDEELAERVRWHEHLSSPIRGTNSDAVGTADWVDLDLSALDALLRARGTACVVIDTYQAALAGKQGWLKSVIELSHLHDALVVADATKCAGRVAVSNYLPDGCVNEVDIVVLGKAIANGAPLSVLLLREIPQDDISRARIGGTYSKERSAIAAAIATSKIMESRNGLMALSNLGNKISAAFNTAAVEVGVGRKVRLAPLFGGTLLAFEYCEDLVADISSRQRMQAALQRNGVLALHGHPNFVMLAHTEILPKIMDVCRAGLRDWSESK